MKEIYWKFIYGISHIKRIIQAILHSFNRGILYTRCMYVDNSKLSVAIVFNRSYQVCENRIWTVAKQYHSPYDWVWLEIHQNVVVIIMAVSKLSQLQSPYWLIHCLLMKSQTSTNEWKGEKVNAVNFASSKLHICQTCDLTLVSFELLK